jgi:hypothetical protein
MTLLGRVVREAYRREAIPAVVRWTLTAQAMRDYFRALARALEPHLGREARSVVSALGSETFRRRYRALREEHPSLPEHDPRAVALLTSALYQLPLHAKQRWILDDLGGAPRGAREHARSLSLARRLDAGARWREVSVHLGELLIVTTETLPARLPRARQIVAAMCHEMGARYARHVRDAFELDEATPVANAIEVLRTSEYLFRVNPKHESGADERAGHGFIDGNACPWYPRPGWAPVHCGIFGQFQAGVCSEFGLSYQLTTTIPKHGGDHCRVDMKPIPLRVPRP